MSEQAKVEGDYDRWDHRLDGSIEWADLLGLEKQLKDMYIMYM